MKRALIHTWTVNGTTIHLFRCKDVDWEIYYSRPEYPMMFAFGLPYKTSKEDAMDLAECNIEDYDFMFD